MIIKLKQDVSKNVLDKMLQKLDSQKTRYQFSKEENLITIMKHTNGIIDEIKNQNIAKEMIPIAKPYVLAVKHRLKPASKIKLGKNAILGGKDIVIMAGPCSVESEEQITKIAKEVKKAGGTILRGGAFKPRTSPYDFQGLGTEGLKMLKKAADLNNLLVISEVLDPRDIDLVAKYADIFQIGTRNMQNFALLKEMGKTRKPVLLKRGMSSTYKELLLAAEYILSGGNREVILCERGIRTFVTETRFTMDISAISYLKKETHLPVIADPSHATGNAKLVQDVALASIAAGADGLIIEAHHSPQEEIVDRDQTIDFKTLKEIVVKSKKIAEIVRN